MRLFCLGAGGCGGHLLTPLMTIPTLQGEKSSDLSTKLIEVGPIRINLKMFIQNVPMGFCAGK